MTDNFIRYNNLVYLVDNFLIISLVFLIIGKKLKKKPENLCKIGFDQIVKNKKNCKLGTNIEGR